MAGPSSSQGRLQVAVTDALSWSLTSLEGRLLISWVYVCGPEAGKSHAREGQVTASLGISARVPLMC